MSAGNKHLRRVISVYADPVSVEEYRAWLLDLDARFRASFDAYNRFAAKVEKNNRIILEPGWAAANEAITAALIEAQAEMRKGPLPPPEYREVARLQIVLLI